ncbi:MAG: GTP cyclohydrolase I FolE [Acidimicrobiales bacterium]|nr:MAG: GTP cyclohydrolase I FolE [Acidimicrobiales bacterium]
MDISRVAHSSLDLPRAAAAVRELLAALGEDPDRDGLRDTPARAAASYAQLLAGVTVDPKAQLSSFPEPHADSVVVLKDIAFASLCEHSLLPFTGVIGVGYAPGGSRQIASWGGVIRMINGYAHRPQVQERLTSQIADAVIARLDPAGVLVVVSATHQCVSAVGERQANSRAITTAARGCYAEDSGARAGLLSLLRSS